MAVYADLFRYRELFGNLFRRDLQAKYKGSVLGVAWSLVNPLVLLGIYLLVFSLLWKAIPVDHPALFLLSGLAIWIFFSTSIHAASRSMLDNANLIRKTRFPRQLVPLSVVATNLVSFGVMMGVLLALDFALLPRARGTMWLALPLGVALVALDPERLPSLPRRGRGAALGQLRHACRGRDPRPALLRTASAGR